MIKFFIFKTTTSLTELANKENISINFETLSRILTKFSKQNHKSYSNFSYFSEYKSDLRKLNQHVSENQTNS
jgi:hypothetical protein